jgi:hypothetical protein
MCADSQNFTPSNTPSNTRRFKLDDIEMKIIRLTKSLTYEGGLDCRRAYKAVTGFSHFPTTNRNAKSSALLQAYKNIMADKLNTPGSNKGILFAIPSSMAYVSSPHSPVSAGAIAATLEFPSDDKLRSAARSISSIITNILRDPNMPRKQILKNAIAECGNQKVKEYLDEILTDQPFDPYSAEIGCKIAQAIRAWYDSKSYEDAISRTGNKSSKVVKLLTGALAGATYGSRNIPRYRWPNASSITLIESTSNALYDLAKDGVLLEPHEMVNLPQYSNANVSTISNNHNSQNINNGTGKKSTIQQTETKINAIPKIPTIPTPKAPTIPTPKIPKPAQINPPKIKAVYADSYPLFSK